MAKLTYAEQQRVARRTADITRLQSQYARSVEDFNAQVGSKETAFKAEMDKYNSAYGSYQQNASAYQSRLSDYQNRLAAYQATPTKTIASQVYYGGAPGGPKYLGNRYVYYRASGPGQEKAIPEGYEFVNTNPRVSYFGDIIGKGVKAPTPFTETFNEVAPTAPAALDISAEKAKLQGEKDYTNREVDERAKAKLRAVQRGNARPMLSAGTNITKAA
jgi:hypothetical protein